MDRFTRLQLEVEAIVKARADLNAVEELLDDTAWLTREEGSALWLYGWSLLPSDHQLDEARAHLVNVRALRD